MKYPNSKIDQVLIVNLIILLSNTQEVQKIQVD